MTVSGTKFLLWAYRMSLAASYSIWGSQWLLSRPRATSLSLWTMYDCAMVSNWSDTWPPVASPLSVSIPPGNRWRPIRSRVLCVRRARAKDRDTFAMTSGTQGGAGPQGAGPRQASSCRQGPGQGCSSGPRGQGYWGRNRWGRTCRDVGWRRTTRHTVVVPIIPVIGQR